MYWYRRERVEAQLGKPSTGFTASVRRRKRERSENGRSEVDVTDEPSTGRSRGKMMVPTDDEGNLRRGRVRAPLCPLPAMLSPEQTVVRNEYREGGTLFSESFHLAEQPSDEIVDGH